jgi:predicted neuraminidase
LSFVLADLNTCIVPNKKIIIMKTIKKGILILAMLMLILTAYAQKTLPEKITAKVLNAEFIYEIASFRSCHASTVLETDEGILTAWFGGTGEGRPDVCIYTSINKNGKWGSPEMVADGIMNDTLRYPCWNPVLFKKDNGDIILFYKVGPSPQKWWGMYKISKDNGKSWSEKVKIPDSFYGPIKDKAVRLKNGTILCPTSIETKENWNIYVETTDQDLKKWRKTKVDNNGFNAIQPTVLFYKGGKIQMLCRSKEKRIVETWSKDKGKTWSPVKATTLINNNSGIDAVSLDNSLQLLICNPIERGRNKLNILASVDGENWKEIIVLEDQPKGEFSYPAIIKGKDGTIHVTYTYNRVKVKYVHLEILGK